MSSVIKVAVVHVVALLYLFTADGREDDAMEAAIFHSSVGIV